MARETMFLYQAIDGEGNVSAETRSPVTVSPMESLQILANHLIGWGITPDGHKVVRKSITVKV